MAAEVANYVPTNGSQLDRDHDDPFLDNDSPSLLARPHRVLPPSHADQATTASEARRILQDQIHENERRLEEAQKLGTSLLSQQDDIQTRLKDLQSRGDESEITPELRQQLAQLEREHEDVGREIARALMPKSRVVSAEEQPQTEASVYSSQATASPTKVTAPSRRHRNQPSQRAGDLQFAADISTSLLAQVRQLQAAVAERDELLKEHQMDRNRIELDTAGLTQRLRALDESEQRYKDENWNLETQNHQLNAAVREAADKEKRLAAAVATAGAEKSRVQNEVEELRAAHEKLVEEHNAAKKAHDTEVHGLKRTVDLGDSEKSLLQARVDELTSQNQELAQAITAKFRAHQAPAGTSEDLVEDEEGRDISALDESPPPSPTKATPRHPGLESETLRSSLHHAHRMIQNLKNNIHREKTEKLELKRMLQDARDDLEHQRGSANSGSKRLKAKPENRKSAKPDMLGGSRRPRTDIEMEDQDWEEHEVNTPTHGRRHLSIPGAFSQAAITDNSDAYATTTEAEGNFETADEEHTNESEAFATGAESLAGDSTDDLTETEDNVSRAQRTGTIRGKSVLASKPAGDRTSFMSTASTSAGEDAEDLTTIVPTQAKFRLKNSRGASRASQQLDNGTPTSARALSVIQGSSPATAINDRSPGGQEQNLFDQLGEMDDMSSNGFGTPGRQSIASVKSTPYSTTTPSRRVTSVQKLPPVPAVVMVDAAVMTEPWTSASGTGSTTPSEDDVVILPTANDFPLPPSVPVSPMRKADMSTQYTPQRLMQGSPSRNANSFITPPKTVWDEASEAGLVSPSTGIQDQPLGYSGMLHQHTEPRSPQSTGLVPALKPALALALSPIIALQTEPSPLQSPPEAHLNGIAVPSPAKRPSSAGSNRTSSLVRQDHPPLPPNHKAAIEQARVASPPPIMSPVRDSTVVMGPPMMPASAMRRPRTPADTSVRSTTRNSYSKGHQRGNTAASHGTQISRRSSVSSFASEVDERFNLRPGEQTAAPGFEASPGTDPRMIQAITQTMIGEFLWKYTRKTGRSDFSDTRHRRYFWVHPYTKTLYWSDQDPQTAGRNELKAKSVAIEAVRVVTDDNPMPPGLHRKSLEITTPGRKVRFTASTGQRHETWFNALSYLLLRQDNQGGDAANVVAAGYPSITQDDVEEFNANGYRARLVPNNSSRASMSSYNSRTTKGTTNRASMRNSAALTGTASSSTQPRIHEDQTADRTSRADQPREADRSGPRTGSMNRISRVMGSITGRNSQSLNRASGRNESNSVYDASVVSDGRKDSAEQLRQEMLREEEGLENVRSCCDGKHDVSTLTHSGRHAHPHSHTHRGWSIRDSVARRTPGA
ncbi:Anucleate primary sterigmata protein A [Cyphellophora attinorum]|uniref:Anucleate primary sterigmata protein A n=1 Tax=Cyphellophora attinorum TaxID=1664694 RepID=A0A0N1NZY3_9EURO|nr:Anucleate primary sterigmata protein A [Phialophora attinorum]KPI42325.1 Anucleate primary sterigmata protein A [Phialophora attinorum]